jgi:hypothetical protein
MITQSNEARRGYNFLPPLETLRLIPGLFETLATSKAEKIVYVHYFIGSCDFWFVEIDPETGIAYGFMYLGDHEHAMWGYISLHKLVRATVGPLLSVVERELYWEPRRASEIPQIKC